MINELCDLTINEASTLLTSKELTVLELVESCLERISDIEDKIHAWVLIDREGVLQVARNLDKEIKSGKKRGALHGIPVGIKDIFYTIGMYTRAGSKSCSEFIPPYDATSVARLKEAGAIILGKTHTTEFAYRDPAPTCNPWNINHTPGGSSSGSGAGVASGMCMAALGSQTQGSVLRPAAYNGVVGFKPHYGRISTYGVVPLAWTFDHVGILARTVEDAALIFQAIAGYDVMDCRSLDDAVPECINKLERQNAPKLGLVEQYFFEQADEEMRKHVYYISNCLRQGGAEIISVRFPCEFSEIIGNGRGIMAVEAASYHQKMYASHKNYYREAISKLIEQGMQVPATEYAEMLKYRLEQAAVVKPLLYQVDALIVPGAVGAAPYGLSSTGSTIMHAPWTIFGIPTISLPTGLNGNGLPLAIQLVGHPKREEHLLSVARWCERILNVRLKPPRIM